MRMISLQAVLVGTGVVLSLGVAVPADQIRWVESYADAQKTAEEKDTLILADFYTDW